MQDKEEKIKKIKLRKNKNYYIGRLEALETFLSVSRKNQNNWAEIYMHYFYLKVRNSLLSKKQNKIKASEAYKLGWEDFTNLKMLNIPETCRRYCAQPKYDFYCLGDCRSCWGYNGSQDILWRIYEREYIQYSKAMQKFIKDIVRR